jgi:predicted HD phosphohydrolase/alpha-ketoglutarate-dependent taurine dioxygenase
MLRSIFVSLALLLSSSQDTVAKVPITASTTASDEGGEDLVTQIRSGQIHPLWLRERCQESFYADPDTHQPRYNLHEEVENLEILKVTTAAAANSEDEKIQVTFSDKQSCVFSRKSLAAEINNEVTFLQTSTWSLPPKFLWTAETLVAPSTFTQEEVLEGDPFQTKKFLSALLTTGIALIEGVPQQAGECVQFGQHFSTLRETEWGREFNVRSVPDDENSGIRKDLAYSAHSIGMHSDNVYRIEEPPAFQLLHAIDHCDPSTMSGCQVHNRMVDGFAVAQTLCENHRDYFDILTSVKLRWENNGGDDSSFLYRYAPMIELENKQTTGDDSCPAVKAINFSAKSGGYAPNLPSEQLDLFYQAKREFSSLLHSDEFAVKVQLYPGALLIFDNRRILHSRSAIAPADGARWLQGCYFNRDGFSYRYEQVRRELSNATETPFYSLFTATRADHDRMGVEYNTHVIEKTKENLLAILEGQKEYYLGQPVSLKEHNIQTASRAYRGGEDDETIFVSLFHDVFENLAVKNHGDLIAAMVAPWTSPKNQWMLAHHEIFQGFYYFHHYEAEGMNRTLRDMYIDEPYYNWTATWCENYDQPSFDPDYPSLPLSVLLPSVERVLAKPQYWWNPNHPKAGAVSNVKKPAAVDE